MNKMDYIEIFAVPGLKTGATILRNKDANSTGTDDVCADIFDYAANAFAAVKNGLPLPDLPISLRPKQDTGELSGEGRIKEVWE